MPLHQDGRRGKYCYRFYWILFSTIVRSVLEEPIIPTNFPKCKTARRGVKPLNISSTPITVEKREWFGTSQLPLHSCGFNGPLPQLILIVFISVVQWHNIYNPMSEILKAIYKLLITNINSNYFKQNVLNFFLRKIVYKRIRIILFTFAIEINGSLEGYKNKMVYCRDWYTSFLIVY